MKVFAHVSPDGRIQGLVVGPEGEVDAGVIAEPGLEVVEIQNHGIKKEATAEQLAQILEKNSVDLTPARGKLVTRKK